MDQFKTKFTQEALELISEIEKSLLLMEVNPGDPDLIEQVFRAMHTLKGNSSMFGFKVMEEFTHHLESLYEYVRNGQRQISRDILDVTFASLDHLALLASTEDVTSEKDKITHEKLSGEIVEIIKGIKNIDNTENLHTADDGIRYHISFIPDSDIFCNGITPLYLFNALHVLGKCEVVPNMDQVPLLANYNTEKCYISWNIYLTSTVDIALIQNEFLFLENRCTLHIREINPEGLLNKDAYNSPVKQDDGDRPANNSKESQPEAAPFAEKKTDDILHNSRNILSSIRVPSAKLDNLMGLVSELMTMQAKLGLLTQENPQSDLIAVTENLEKISTRLRDNAFSMCLVPIETMITPLQRLVRNLAHELNKEIDFTAEGTETELEKTIMQGLSDPLMHLIRNSIDHGIEEPSKRIEMGKPGKGKILFKAYYAGNNVYIEIKDDGNGIDTNKIKIKAVQKGIIKEDELLSEKELLNLIFLPGFSTAEQVSEISGRGVGMDVVKRKIADIKGKIIISSIKSKGTTTTIKLPITVSIIDGLSVKINGADFVIPLSAVDRCYQLPAGKVLNRFNNIIVLDDEQIPFIQLNEELDGTGNIAASREIVVVFYDEMKVGLIVESITGKMQAVLKPLGNHFLRMENISGATILGDGNIALILDTNKIIEQSIMKKTHAIC